MFKRLQAAGRLAYEALRYSPSERAFRRPRVWANTILLGVCSKLNGSILNASGWKDEDKEGRRYSQYFHNASSYTVSNFKYSQGGMQGLENEVYIDLSKAIDDELKNRFDVVFCHTVLEHIYEFQSAIDGLCDLSRDVVVVVVPWLQEMHSDYGDYWRFSPTAISRLFETRGFHTVYIDWNAEPATSVYIVAVLSRNPAKWCESFRELKGKELPSDGALPNEVPGAVSMRGGL